MNPAYNLILISFLLFSRFVVGENILNNPETKSDAYPESDAVYSQLDSSDLSSDAFYAAFEGFIQLRDNQFISNDSLLTIIDYSLPSDKKRLWIVDVKNCSVLENSLVAHGKASGELFAQSFSDVPQSHKSSLGFFITGCTYSGKHGYSLMIDGIEEGINKNARKRSIVFHGANYVSSNYIQKNGRLGRSFGCPALPVENNKRIIDLIKDESCVFIYSADKYYFNHSKLVTPRKPLQTNY